MAKQRLLIFQLFFSVMFLWSEEKWWILNAKDQSFFQLNKEEKLSFIQLGKLVHLEGIQQMYNQACYNFV